MGTIEPSGPITELWIDNHPVPLDDARVEHVETRRLMGFYAKRMWTVHGSGALDQQLGQEVEVQLADANGSHWGGIAMVTRPGDHDGQVVVLGESPLHRVGSPSPA